ncbi:MAG: FtsQ-type POTRA domain-containing protein [Patescibacteria group bacterium]
MSRILYTPGREKKIRGPKRIWIFPAVLGMFFALAIAGGIFFLRRPEWQISAVAIDGLRVIPESAMRSRVAGILAGAYLGLVPRSSVLLARGHAIAEDLKKEFPPIRDVAVRKRFPNRLDIRVTERRLWGIFCNDLKPGMDFSCVAVDETGYAYAPSPAAKGALILLVRSDGDAVPVGAFAIESGVIDLLRRIADQMPASAGSAPLSFELPSGIRSEFRAVMPEGYYIIFRRDGDLANALRVLKKVLDEEIKDKRTDIDYIDLRFGNKVFYKMR